MTEIGIGLLAIFSCFCFYVYGFERGLKQGDINGYNRARIEKFLGKRISGRQDEGIDR
jgi:hypothetical protein